MSLVPTYATPPGFLGLQRTSAAGAAFAIVGIPLDLGTSNRSGAREAPAAIRRASRMLVDGAHPASWVDALRLALADSGDFQLQLGDLPGSLAAIERQARACTADTLIALGGEHAITLPLLRACHARFGAPLGLLHVDAHVDTWDDTFGNRLAHGSFLRRAIEERLVDPARVVQLGIRSPVQRAVWDWTLAQGITVITAQHIHMTGIAAAAARARSVLGTAPTYVSFDIDALDPAFAPGTGTPEIGGLASWQAQALLRDLGGLRLVGLDVVEVAPAYDHAEITALAAATMVWEFLCRPH